jgi:hypothetical protein
MLEHQRADSTSDKNAKKQSKSSSKEMRSKKVLGLMKQYCNNSTPRSTSTGPRTSKPSYDKPITLNFRTKLQAGNTLRWMFKNKKK